jgi:hypothetical protein
MLDMIMILQYQTTGQETKSLFLSLSWRQGWRILLLAFRCVLVLSFEAVVSLVSSLPLLQ